MTQKMTSKDAKIRFYDSTATPYYLELDLDPGDITFPLGTPLTEEMLILNRGNMDANAHYIEGPDAPMMAAVPVSFSIVVTDQAQTTNILNWLAAMNDALATQVNSHTLATCEGDSQRDGATANPAFADANKSLCSIEYLLTMAGTDLGWKLMEVWVPMDQQSLSEAEDGVTISLSGMIYGTITRITSFTAGTDVEA